MMSIGGSVRTLAGQQYLAAARSGNLMDIKRAIAANVDVNYRDEFGRSALELALIGNHATTVEYLLPRLNVICVEDALMYAIDTDNLPFRRRNFVFCEDVLEKLTSSFFGMFPY
ncbi:hypothetical protein NP493_1128g00033 [Ridgeia piscesae]|uniref:ANK_REP_REGION domain-containing protein n=1 Tax=Ridgeia piscesae TaxID=27915 RepID=A0AAD9NI46_RIDPI|nr:hypothetical protein NP493_1128g00033 [Ridgeia piscesae]